ncbi:BlaI/MecI/CopY family transcriptional regulator [Alicyclobacillus fodiniaquatilis]|jgi:predicted transcriptional regulator|uniref:BlaI/MecI/CopY family transcriptional regulator n=1 Tax=Alicyclobacillus fodiniaquatilis TaxID=1661150 RepID=A0ABW4JDP7_9BACL
MSVMKKLPDAEFDIMKVVWASEPPVSSNTVMEQLGNERGWKAPTAISLLLRLVERGFLRTQKNGKERVYYPLVTKEEYLKFETGNFMRQFHGNSFLNLVNTLYSDNALTEKDIDELREVIQRAKEQRD